MNFKQLNEAIENILERFTNDYPSVDKTPQEEFNILDFIQYAKSKGYKVQKLLDTYYSIYVDGWRFDFVNRYYPTQTQAQKDKFGKFMCLGLEFSPFKTTSYMLGLDKTLVDFDNAEQYYNYVLKDLESWIKILRKNNPDIKR